MAPLYTHCPHCGFPVIIRGLDRLVARRCRQCRGKYFPQDGVQAARRRTDGCRGSRLAVQRAALRAYIRQRRRSAI